jgi:hypothetical protein
MEQSRFRIQEMQIDFMMLADGAQALGGKLYVLGGAWNRLHLPRLPSRPGKPFDIAVGIRVPWHLTNRQFVFGLQLLDADGNPVGDDGPIGIEMEAGRPPGLRQGTEQLLVFSLTASPEFPRAGMYAFEATIDSEPKATTAFEVVHLPGAPDLPPSGGEARPDSPGAT